MQIGRCWIDDTNQQLVTDDGRVWQLSFDEYQVINCLIENRDKVVSRQHLYQLINDPNQPLALIDIIHQFQKHIGTSHASMLEVVGDQGYMLLSKPTTQSRLNTAPYQVIPILAYSMVMVVICLLLVWLFPRIEEIEVKFDNIFQQQFTTSNGKPITLQVFPVDKNQMERVKSNTDNLQTQLLQCKNVPWQTISYAISGDSSMLHLILYRESGNQHEYRNIKLYKNEANIYFVTPSWLVEMGVCDEQI
ncbi:hypothetical protein [Shewanella sp. NIFS-20-20]|uniref:hypothetical protein n=1 Tax=Shewanella sp. NIFS-20-20 TaxID=2853806 RepID=UPI001C4441FE|nr:hypothetical protein [Shewanella sp. NIFS-20-20]MBV7317255.1 hypothetical protein [Shewanella sp. NIFS-20-20]